MVDDELISELKSEAENIAVTQCIYIIMLKEPLAKGNMPLRKRV